MGSLTNKIEGDLCGVDNLAIHQSLQAHLHIAVEDLTADLVVYGNRAC